MLKKLVLISMPVVFLASYVSSPSHARTKQPLPHIEYMHLAEDFISFDKCLDYGHIDLNDYGRARTVLYKRVQNLSYKYLIDFDMLEGEIEIGKTEFDMVYGQIKKNSVEEQELKNLCSKLTGVYNVVYEESNRATR